MILQTLLLGISLAMDAFAVSVAAACASKVSMPIALRSAGSFALFQFAMPMTGWFFASFFRRLIASIDHWIALILLAFVGLKTLIPSVSDLVKAKREARRGISSAAANEGDGAGKGAEGKECAPARGLESLKTLLALDVATSIDALSVGVIYSASAVELAQMLFSALVIGLVTFAICLAGFFIGRKANSVFGMYAQIAGGIVLIIIGIRIFISHVTSGA